MRKSIFYMEKMIPIEQLYSKAEVLKLLDIRGGLDTTLDEIRTAYVQRFDNQLIWKYPFSDDMRGGGSIVPVKEGFLFLPYSCVYKDAGARYDLRGAELLNAETATTLITECQAYGSGLCNALQDIAAELSSSVPPLRYQDKAGNFYYVRTGICDVYQAFRRFADPQDGQKKESPIEKLRYRMDRKQAQRDLDKYAQAHALTIAEGVFDE